MRESREPILFTLPPRDRCRSRPAVARWGGDNRTARDTRKEILLCPACAGLLCRFLAGQGVPGLTATASNEKARPGA